LSQAVLLHLFRNYNLLIMYTALYFHSQLPALLKLPFMTGDMLLHQEKELKAL